MPRHKFRQNLPRWTAPLAARQPRRSRRKRKVIYDQDNSGPFGTDILGTLMMLQADNIDLLGITLVTGDAWMKQEMAYTLRLLEMMGRTEIPVYPGAEFPMLNTKEEWLLRPQLFGGHRLDPWMGAFNRSNGGPDDIKPLPPPYDRFAKIESQQEHAARFIINAVRAESGRSDDLCRWAAHESGAGHCARAGHRAAGARSRDHGRPVSTRSPTRSIFFSIPRRREK